MKEWNAPVVLDLDVSLTASGEFGTIFEEIGPCGSYNRKLATS